MSCIKPCSLIRVAAGVAAILILQSAGLLAAELTIGNVSVRPGATATVSVTLSAQNVAVSALQFDLTYDHAALTVTATAGPATLAADKRLSVIDISPTTKRFVIFGLNVNALGDGSVVDLIVHAGPSASGGAHALEMDNVVGSDPAAQRVKIASSNGRVIRYPNRGR